MRFDRLRRDGTIRVAFKSTLKAPEAVDGAIDKVLGSPASLVVGGFKLTRRLDRKSLWFSTTVHIEKAGGLASESLRMKIAELLRTMETAFRPVAGALGG